MGSGSAGAPNVARARACSPREEHTALAQQALSLAGVPYPDATMDLDDLFLPEARQRVYKDVRSA